MGLSEKKIVRSKNERLMVEHLNKNLGKLIQLDNKKTAFQLSINKGRPSSVGCFDTQQEIISKCYFFVSMIGFIEDKINSDNILLESDHLTEDEQYQMKVQIQTEKNFRNTVVKNFSDNKHKYCLAIEDLIEAIIRHYPVYDHFDKIYRDMEISHYDLPIHNEFMLAYCLGRKLSKETNVEYIFKKYQELYCQYIDYKTENMNKIYRTGNAYQLIKIIDHKNLMEKNHNVN